MLFIAFLSLFYTIEFACYKSFSFSLFFCPHLAALEVPSFCLFAFYGYYTLRSSHFTWFAFRHYKFYLFVCYFMAYVIYCHVMDFSQSVFSFYLFVSCLVTGVFFHCICLILRLCTLKFCLPFCRGLSSLVCLLFCLTHNFYVNLLLRQLRLFVCYVFSCCFLLFRDCNTV